MNGVGTFPLLAAAERQQLSCLLRHTPEPVRRNLTGEDGTSPFKTRIWSFRRPPSGRFPRCGSRRSTIATGSNRCAYEIVSGRPVWPNRDPLGEPGFEKALRRSKQRPKEIQNLYSFLRNQPISLVDPDGLFTFSCGGSFNFGAGIGGGFSFYFGFDSSGRIGGGVNFAGGAVLGAGISATADINISTADSMGQLAGPGLQVGASMQTPGAGPVLGLDAFFGGHPSTSDDYMGLSGHLGLGVGLPAEIHAQPGYTCGH